SQPRARGAGRRRGALRRAARRPPGRCGARRVRGRAGSTGESLRAAAERAGRPPPRRRHAGRRPSPDGYDRRRHRGLAARRGAAVSRQSGRPRPLRLAVSAIVALDAGTGGAKCTVFDVSGRLLAMRSERWDYTVVAHRDVPLVKEYAFDPDEFWRALARCAAAALGAARIDPASVLGVATTSQREGCVFLDADGRELYAGPNLDSRAFMEGLEVLGELGGERLYAITGHSAPFIFPLARYLWYRKQGGEPVARVLMINDWMTYRLCGVVSAEPSNASESMMFDFRARRWSDEILEHFEIPAA